MLISGAVSCYARRYRYLPAGQAGVSERLQAVAQNCGLLKSNYFTLHIHKDSHRLQVASYVRRYRYSPAEQADVSERLQVVVRLLKQHDCTDSGQLLDAATKAEASLDTWFRMEGLRPLLAYLFLCNSVSCCRQCQHPGHVIDDYQSII